MPSSTILGETWTNQCLVDNFVNRQWIRSESEYVWKGEFDMNTLWSHNVWTRIFSYPEKKSCGFKNIWIRVDGALFSLTLTNAGGRKATHLNTAVLLANKHSSMVRSHRGNPELSWWEVVISRRDKTAGFTHVIKQESEYPRRGGERRFTASPKSGVLGI